MARAGVQAPGSTSRSTSSSAAPPAAAARDKAIDERADRIAASTTSAARRVASPGGPQVADTGAGVILGAVLWALVLNWLRYGAAGARGWLSAKFLNKPMQVNAATSAGAKIAEKAAER
jgi:hypothetical protein